MSIQAYFRLHSEGDEKDGHAGQGETSLMMYWCPELVRMDEIALDEEKIAGQMRKDPDCYAKEEKSIDNENIISWIHQREEIKVGVMGYPKLASRELGERLSREMEEGIVEFIKMLEENK